MTNAIAMMLGGAIAEAAAAFDPVTDITWHSLYCAELSDFQAQAYSDGANVTIIPDEIGTKNVVGTSDADLTYKDSDPDLNGAASLVYTGGNVDHSTASFTAISAPYSTVHIFHCDVLSSFQHLLVDATNSNIYSIGFNSLGRVTMTHGGGTTTLSGAVITAGTTHGLVHLSEATEHTVWVDDNEELNVTGTSTSSPVAWHLGSRTDNQFALHGQLAFTGIYEGDIRADPEWANFQTWALDTYGATI